MPDKARQILSVDPRSPYAGGLTGLPIERAKDPVTRRLAIYDHQFKYLITLTREDLDKLNTWARSNNLGVFLSRSFYLDCTIGYPDTPEQIAYDAIDQQGEATSSPPLHKTRKRQRTSSGYSDKVPASCSQCSAKPKRSRSRRRASPDR